MQPKITLSIGIPSYNQSKYIAETVRSVLSQTVKPFEIVVCENYSTDNTMEVLADFEGQIRVIHPPKHLPMMENWNYLVSQLGGTWFSLFSSDDTAQPNFVENVLTAAERNVNSVLIGGGYNVINERSEITETRYLMSLKSKTSFPNNFIERLTNPKFSFGCFACKKESWLNAGMFPNELKLFGDWGMWLSLSVLGDFIYIDKLLANYRDYSDSRSSNRKVLENDDYLYIYNELIPAIIKENNLILRNRELQIIGRKFRDIEDIWLPFVNDEEKKNAIKSLYAKYGIDRDSIKISNKNFLYSELKKIVRVGLTMIKK